jgi:Uma2 family endonuclease
MFCSWSTLESKRVTVSESVPGTDRYPEVVGAPDLVLEIVSKSSIRKDTQVLKERYFAAGINEYWLVDARRAAIDFQILKRGQQNFEPVTADRRGFRASTVLPWKFKLTRERDRIGQWRYTLLHAE